MSQKFEVTSPGEWGWSCNWLRITWNQCTCICEHIWFESTHQRPSSGKLKYCKGGLDPISCTNFRKIAHQVYFKQHSMHQKLKGKTSKISSRVLSCLSLVHKFTIQIHLPVRDIACGTKHNIMLLAFIMQGYTLQACQNSGAYLGQRIVARLFLRLMKFCFAE